MSATIELDTGTLSAEQDQLRAGVWNLLATLLAGAPTQELLDSLAAIEEPEGAARDPMGQAWLTLRLAAERARPEALLEEYQDVFIGLGSGEVTAYASWYLTGSLMERPLIALRQELEALGFEREEGVSEPEDHAAVVCQIMALLIGDPEYDFQRQRDVFQRHVEPWLGRLFQDLQKAPSAAFYRAVGGLGQEFYQLEQRYYSMLG